MTKDRRNTILPLFMGIGFCFLFLNHSDCLYNAATASIKLLITAVLPFLIPYAVLSSVIVSSLSLTNGKFAKRNASSGTITANEGYGTFTSSATSLPIEKSATTSIDSIAADSTKVVKYYDLKGNLVEKPTRGIYITSEGKKILVY